MGFFHGTTNDIPNVNSYAEAKAFHDATKLNKHRCRWPSQTKIKHVFTRNGDDSITFKLYETECVTYHPDGAITVQGYGSQTTSGFIDRLTPMGINHLSHGRTNHGPMLQLRPVVEHVDPPNAWRDEEHRWMGLDWGAGVIVRCGSPVRLHYNVERGHWMPADPLFLRGDFELPTINHKRGCEVARQYRLANFDKIAQAYITLQRIRSHQGESMYTVATALREGRLADACKGVPVGGTVQSYGRRWGGPGQPDPAFFRQLRDWIYDHEGVIDYETLPMLTPQQYERYLKMSKRF